MHASASAWTSPVLTSGAPTRSSWRSSRDLLPADRRPIRAREASVTVGGARGNATALAVDASELEDDVARAGREIGRRLRRRPVKPSVVLRAREDALAVGKLRPPRAATITRRCVHR